MSECKCGMRARLVGDGCHVCNPELAKELDGPASDCANSNPFGAQFEAMAWLLVPRKQYDQLKAQRDALKWLAMRTMARAGTVVLLRQGKSESAQEAVEGLQELISQAAELFERIEKEGPA